jgi:UDP:flavonoid glycosyltransferase YjiC (YdhE family)
MPVARHLREMGHDVLFAVRDVRVAAKVLTPASLPFVQAPVMRTRIRLLRPPANYSEMLLAEGYAQPTALAGCLAAWRQLVELYRPDVLVADHGPTASIAARACDIPFVQFGCGFAIPPVTHPMRRFNAEDRTATDERLHASERTLVQNTNAALRSLNRSATVRSLADVFAEESAVFAVFPELDHYGERAGANYIGPILTPSGTQACTWVTNRPTKIFAYLHDGVPGTSAIVEELSKADAEVICVVTESTPQVREKFSSASMRLFGEPVRLQQVLPQTSLVISNGGGALTSQALLGGVPMLMLPAHTEQLMQSICVERLGAGRAIGMQRDRSTIASAIGEVLDSTQYQTKARAFARKHASFDSSESVKSAARTVLRVAGEQRRRH